MYTGIVQATRPIESARPYAGGLEFALRLTPELVKDLQIGGSVAVEGVCLSATKIDGDLVSFDAMTATLERTNLEAVATRGEANVERSAKPTDENGGHNIAGHIATTGEIVTLDITPERATLRIKLAADWAKFVFPRGFVAINGCSLTVAEKEELPDGSAIFQINLIPETLRQTTFTRYALGDHVNVEVDHQTMVMVSTIESVLGAMVPKFLGALASKG